MEAHKKYKTLVDLMARSHCTEPGMGQVQGMGSGSMGFCILCLLFTLH